MRGNELPPQAPEQASNEIMAKCRCGKTKSKNKEKGNYGESLALRYIEQKGYTVLETNYRCARGEIDIICMDGDTLVFVEVKFRKSLAYGYPREAVNYPKQSRIKKVAEYYIYQKKIMDRDCRFDVIEIIAMCKPEIIHLENAFMV